MSLSIQNSQVKNDNRLVRRVEAIKHNLDKLKIPIPGHPDKGAKEFDRDVNSRFDKIEDDINQTKDFICAARQEDFQEEQVPRISKMLEEVFERVEKKIIGDADAMKAFEVSYGHLEKLEQKLCFLFLSIFPKNAIIARRPLIYLWMGEGLITREEEGEEIFEQLLKHNLIIPHGKNPHVNKCQIHPCFHYMLISLAKKANLFEFDSRGNINSSVDSRRACLTFDSKSVSLENGKKNDKSLRTIFNIDDKYISLDSKLLSKLLSKLEKLVVLQLGRWHNLKKHHIEIISSEAILRELVAHKHLKYLSLRGISRLTSLPPSIFELISLEILDLKACHNLQKLPLNIASLRKLTHFDVSECYFLENMPKGLDKLTSLQVLKGHVIGSSSPNPCTIGQLINLKNLKRLSMYIGNDEMETGQLSKLGELSSVWSLKISWIGTSVGEKKPIVKQSLSFPTSLKTLKLENVPQEKLEWLNPQTLPNLKKLYIMGGKLSSLNHVKIELKWNVEILHLMYLKNLEIGLSGLKELFPSLKYVQTKCREGYASKTSEKFRSYMDLDEWSKEDSK